MTSNAPELHGLPAALLRRDLLDARARTLNLVADLEGDRLWGPRLPIINPFLWEIGHVAWFQEHWVLRRHLGEAPTREDGDALYDSMRIPHDTRWDLPLPSRTETLEYMERILGRVLDRLRSDPVDPHLAYFVRHVTFHEDMHDEAFTYTRQTLGYPAPTLHASGPWASREPSHPKDTQRSASGPGVQGNVARAGGGTRGDVEFPGGTWLLGASPDREPFVFDNEKWAHPVPGAPFAIARTPVTNGEFVAFVADGGYERPELWTPEGWQWRVDAHARHPVYWRPLPGGGWERRAFDRWVELGDDLVLVHVNWFEADAYARWAGRRLPTEAEWEVAAAASWRGPESGRLSAGDKRRYPWGNDRGDVERANLEGTRLGTVEADAFPEGDSLAGCRQLLGNAWVWTASPFLPYPGFTPDPYREYSEPWFDGRHMVLRGGAWATRIRLLRNTWRNFYPRDRRDVFAGIRTCARAS